MDIKDVPFVRGFMKMADDCFRMGWHERNGGNMSCRMSEDEVSKTASLYNKNAPWQELGIAVPGLADEYFLVTGSGKYFSNISTDPADTLCILQVSESGDKYRVLWGLENGGRPTSELPSHLLNHEVKKRVTNGRSRIMYHGHPENIIALSFVLPCDEKV